jgi:hypothetical protein
MNPLAGERRRDRDRPAEQLGRKHDRDEYAQGCAQAQSLSS